MRYAKGRKDETQRQLLEIASRRIREAGVEGSGIAAIMAEAKLTNGAFYAHFASKDDLVRRALMETLDRRIAVLDAAIEAGTGIAPIIRDYLSERHRDDPGRGCTMATLASDMHRAPRATQEAFAARNSAILDRFARLLPGGSEAERRSKAVTLYALMVGALQMARIVSEAEESRAILDTAATAALSIAAA